MTRRNSRSGGRQGGSAYQQGREKAVAEKEKYDKRREAQKEAGNMPFRLWLKPGEERVVVILDDEPTFFRHEHNFKNPQTGNWDGYAGCVKETDSCPACKTLGKESYYAMYLSVIDLTPYDDKDGNEVPASRKLLVVKPQQQAKWFRKIDKVLDEEDSLRGAVFVLARSDENAANIGDDIEFDGFEDLSDNPDFEREWQDRDKKWHVEDLTEVYDYEKLFPEASVEDLEDQFDVAPAMGSDRYADDRESRGSSGRSGRRSSQRRSGKDDGGSSRGSRRGRGRDDNHDADNHDDEQNDFKPENDSQEEYGSEESKRGNRGRSRDSSRGRRTSRSSENEPKEDSGRSGRRTSRRTSRRSK